MPRDHTFVRSTNPNFGSAFGGACAHEADGIMCGWPEFAHSTENAEVVDAYTLDSIRPIVELARSEEDFGAGLKGRP